MGIEEWQVDIDERPRVMAMIETMCGCMKGIGSRPYLSQYTSDYVLSVRASCSELTRSELDMFVMSQLMAGMKDDTKTNTHARNREKDQLRVAYSFHYQGKQVCEKMFRFLHNFGETCYKNLKKSLLSNGLVTHSHGNLNHTPAHALSLSSTEFVVRFVMN